MPTVQNSKHCRGRHCSLDALRGADKIVPELAALTCLQMPCTSAVFPATTLRFCLSRIHLPRHTIARPIERFHILADDVDVDLQRSRRMKKNACVNVEHSVYEDYVRPIVTGNSGRA